MERAVCNAEISSVEVMVVKGSILTLMVGVNYGGSSQSFGGYQMAHKERIADGTFGEWMKALFATFEIENFRDLKGLPCRVDANNSQIFRIGHFLKDKWVDPQVIEDSLKPDPF